MIYILLVCLIVLLIAFYFVNNRSYLSVSFFATAVFALSALCYIWGLRLFEKDIEEKTFYCIIISLIFLMMGEQVGKKINVRLRYLPINNKGQVYVIKNSYIYSITVVMLLIFIYRFIDLYLFSLTIGNHRGILATISSTRLSYAMGEYKTILPFYFLSVIGTLIAEILAYFFIYVFVNNCVILKYPNFKLLLPVMGYSIIVVALTERIPYIKIAVYFFISIIIANYRNNAKKKIVKINSKIVKSIIKIGILFSAFFFGYGMFVRGSADELTLSETIAAYVGAPIYGLNHYLQNPWGKNTEFGYYTLSGLHRTLNRFGAAYGIPRFHLDMFEYGNQLTSNIYTYLVLPIQDYGMLLALFLRIPIGLLNGFFQTKMMLINMKNAGGIVVYIFTGILFYCGLMAFCADQYIEYLLTPQTFIKYTLFAWVVIKFFTRYQVYNVTTEGEKQHE